MCYSKTSSLRGAFLTTSLDLELNLGILVGDLTGSTGCFVTSDGFWVSVEDFLGVVD